MLQYFSKLGEFRLIIHLWLCFLRRKKTWHEIFLWCKLRREIHNWDLFLLTHLSPKPIAFMQLVLICKLVFPAMFSSHIAGGDTQESGNWKQLEGGKKCFSFLLTFCFDITGCAGSFTISSPCLSEHDPVNTGVCSLTQARSCGAVQMAKNLHNWNQVMRTLSYSYWGLLYTNREIVSYYKTLLKPAR